MILAIETSCDETAAAIVTDDGEIVTNVVASQAELHARFGGVVPEVASRRHLELVNPVIHEALAAAGATLDDVEAVAVTTHPGLIGALLVGVSAAKALAWSKRLPLVPVDHLHGHVASLYLKPLDLQPPFTCLLASGGHTMLLDVQDRGGYRVLGTTLDDAAGEAFDKGARLLGLGYPGGREIDLLAREGDPQAYDFPVARLPGLDFSFSGLKTAARRTIDVARADAGLREPEETLPHAVVAELAWGFQDSVTDVLVSKTIRAARAAGARSIVLGGGVAANAALRTRLAGEAAELGVPLIVPRPGLCTDNGAMIGAAGARRFLAGERAGLDLEATPSLPLAR